MSALECSGDDARDDDFLVAESREIALSNAPGFDSLLDAGGESLLLLGGDSGAGDPTGETDLTGVRGEPAFVIGGSHFDFNEGFTGMVISAWITCVIGAANGAGKVGGKELNSLSRGGSILQVEVQYYTPVKHREFITHPVGRSSNRP